MMLDALLALGLLLSTATQLRPAGSPVGPGEICLVVWLIPTFCRTLLRPGPPLTPPLFRLPIFWALFALAQSLGTLTGIVLGDEHDPRWFWHDVMAYPFLAALSCLSVLGAGAGHRLHRSAWFLLTLGGISLAFQLANACGLFDIPLIEPWFEQERLQGWSENPNQLALLCVVLGLLSLHLADTAGRLTGRLAALACLLLSICVGRLTKSDTLTMVFVAAGPIFLALKLSIWLTSWPRRVTFKSAFAWIAVISLPLVLASTAPILVAITDPGRVAIGLMKNNGKEAPHELDLRLELWREAISRGMESGMLGLGPGPHLEIPISIVAARQGAADLASSDHPALNAMPNFEAHNTLLDLFTQGGLIAVSGLVWLMGTTLLTTYKARQAGLTTLLCGLGIFGFTGLIVRPPMFWFAIALCLVAAPVAQPPVAARNWS